MTGRSLVRWLVGSVVVLHGLLHLLGGAKGLGWSTVSSLTQPIGRVTGGIWLVVAVLVVVAGLLLALATRGWWLVGGVAAVASEAVIATSWADARAGTVVNVALMAAAVYGWASEGPPASAASTAAGCRPPSPPRPPPCRPPHLTAQDRS